MAYTNIDDPSAHFQIAPYTGNGDSADDTNAITNTGNSDLQPDFIWLKRRDYDNGHQLIDSTRGVTKLLGSELSSAETTLSGRLASFDTDGFTVQSSSGAFNAENEPFIAWQWKANGGTTASNTTGDINTTTQVNSDAGFSIVTYTGNGGTNQTVGHGLGVSPQVIIVKNREVNANWIVYHHKTGTSKYLNLDTAGAAADSSNIWGSSAPSSTTFTVQQHNEYNDSGEGLVAYCFAEKQGYSKFDSYVGNGNVNGPFVYTGFQPAWILLKRSDSASGGNWSLIDNKRSASGGANVNVYSITANTADAESTGEAESTYGVDFLSNGFKIRASHVTRNASGASYIYMAFAENPFVTSTGVPTTAR